MWNCIQNAALNKLLIFFYVFYREVYILPNLISILVCIVFYFWLTDSRTQQTFFLGWIEDWLENYILWYNFLKYVFMSNRIAQTKSEKSHTKFCSWV